MQIATSPDPAHGEPAAPTLVDILPSLVDLAGSRRATDSQRDALARLSLGTPPEYMSFEQASALLSARAYIAALLHQIGERRGSGERRALEAHLIAFVLKDPLLLQGVIKWDARSDNRGSADIANPRRDEHWEKIASEARRLQGRA